MSSTAWKELQQKIFSRWCQQKLAARKLPFESVLKDFADGLNLVALIEILSETKMPGKALKAAKNRMGQIDNANRALKFVFDQNVQLTLKPSPENLVDGDERAIMSLVWGIMLRFLKFNDDEEEAMTAEQALLMWVNNQIADYGVKVKDFKKSFHDGKVYAMIIHKNRPRVIDPATLTGSNEENCDKAMTAAQEYFGLDRYIEPSDIPKLDNKSQFVFCSEFYSGVARERKKDLAARRIAKLIEYTKINDALRADYAKQAKETKDTLDKVNAMLGDRSIDNTMAGAVQKLEDYYAYKKSDKKVIIGNFLKLESIYGNLKIRLEDHKRPEFKAEEGQSVEEFKSAVAALEKLDAERSVELIAELTRQKTLVQINKQHQGRYEKVKAWCTQKLAYLKERETIDSSGAAEFHLNVFSNYEDELEALRGTSLKDMGGLTAQLSEGKYEHLAKVEAKEEEVKALQAELATEGKNKSDFLDDCLAKNQYKEAIELVALKFASKADSADAWVADKTAYLEKKEEINSVNEAQLALSTLDSYEGDKKDIEAGQLVQLKELSDKILSAVYTSPITESNNWKYSPAESITSRLEALNKALGESLPALSSAKHKTLDEALALELEKERLRLLFANQASSLERWSKSKSEDYEADIWWGDDLDAVVSAKAKVTEEDERNTEEGKKRAAEAAETFHQASKLGVTENAYTQLTTESLEASTGAVQTAIQARNERYAAELARVTANDELCQEFAKLANPLVETIEKNREVINKGLEKLEEEKALLEQSIAAKLGESELKTIVELQGKLDANNVPQNKHSNFTANDVSSRLEQYSDFLASKLEQVQDRIRAETSRGITPEQLAEIDAQFTQFDKNKNKILDKNEFKACLYSLGEERPTSEVKQIMKEHGDGKSIPYEGFKAFMLSLLGDTETKEEILGGFQLLAQDEPTVSEKNLTDVFPNLEDVEYLKQETPKDGDRLKYAEWTEAVFAR
jgi:Ca2+-binding EF-hand superfamily protein